MVCDKCKEREAVCEFAYGNQPRSSRTWNLCETCLQQFAPGFPAHKQIDAKNGSEEPLKAGESSCGWVSFSPDEMRHKR